MEEEDGSSVGSFRIFDEGRGLKIDLPKFDEVMIANHFLIGYDKLNRV